MKDEIDTMQFERINKETEDKMAILEDIFNSGEDRYDQFELTQNLPFQDTADYQKDELVPDYDINKYNFSGGTLDDTKKIDGVQLEELKKLRNQIEEMDTGDDKNHSNDSQSKGKQKVLTSHPGVSFGQDVKEIYTSFVNCFVLSFVTAAIGAGWLVNLILHIK